MNGSSLGSPFISLPTNKKGIEFPIYQEKVEEWSETYPDVDVLQTLKEIKQWLRDNHTKRKTTRGMLAFVNRWMARVQDAPPIPSNTRAR